jgi:Uma2 family endonuclease
MSTTTLPVPLPAVKVPPLVDGERLARAEFERRYHATPENVKAELIEGVVYMASPVRWKGHSGSDVRLIGWVAVYQSETPGTECGSNGTVRLSDEDEPQPDCFLFILEEHGGSVRISADDYPENAPDLIVEIAGSSASKDLNPKKRTYAKNGVREYIVWRTIDRVIDWFFLKDGAYVSLAADKEGIIRSETFPGLWLNVPAALRRDTKEVLATVHLGLQSPEHATFVAELQARRIA